MGFPGRLSRKRLKSVRWFVPIATESGLTTG